LSFTPVVLRPNRISLQISTEVSGISNANSLTVSGTTGSGSSETIPGLEVRRAETTIELPSGGSFAIAGLLQHITKQEIDAFPGLKDMPVLGALFRSRDFQNNETELVVMVSAYLVNPVAEDKIALPTDGFKPASDLQTILMGKLNQSHKAASDAAAAKASGAKAADNGKTGFIVE
jgi:pilus assembly protein CpaC